MDFLIAFSAGHIKLRKPDEPLTLLPDCSSTADPLKQQAALQSVESAIAH
ncbi:hypothetical protein T492DRAFT_858794 [Pavlovales sp. CCMP2436]|nr:hypothetical protein T492DRAFT_858794 [Pavlovales sp. CCMP2436]